MGNLEIGRVKFFLADKGFGYIIIDGSKKEIFFHCSHGRQIELSGNEPKFSSTRPEKEPKKGDVVIFERASSSRGPKADPYGFMDDWNRAKKEINPRLAVS